MDLGSLHVNYCWIMWPLCLISITHTNTHSQTHTNTRATYKWPSPLYCRVMIVCKSRRSVCIQRDQTRREDCVCVSVCCRAKAIIMTYIKATYNNMRDRRERDKHCVCLDSRPYTLPRAQSYKMSQYMWFKADECTLILHRNTHPHTSHNTWTPYYLEETTNRRISSDSQNWHLFISR